MWKTFIEAGMETPGPQSKSPESLPLMWKTFIEAFTIIALARYRVNVSSAYVEDFH